MITIRNAKPDDLKQIVEVENECFLPEEAGSEEAFKERIEKINDTFFVAEEDGMIIGLINGPVIKQEFISDDLFTTLEKNPDYGYHQSILGLAISPTHQKRGIASKLLDKLKQEAINKKRDTITLTCKEELIPFYEVNGYTNMGVSESTHGGAIWYNMSIDLK